MNKPMSNLAVAGMALGGLSVLLMFLGVGILPAIAAVVCGHCSLAAIRRAPDALEGRGVATAALITGYIAIAVSLIMIAIIVHFAIPAYQRSKHDPSVTTRVRHLRGEPPATAWTAAMELCITGRQADAEFLLDAMLDVHPRDTRLLFFRGTLRRSRFSKTGAAAYFARIERSDPTSIEARCGRYVMDLDAGKDVEATFAQLRRTAREHMDNPLILWLLAIECREHRRNEEGATYYALLEKTFTPGPVLFHQTYANVLSEGLNRHEEALIHRQTAVRQEPAGWSYQGLGNTLTQLKRYEEADRAFAECLACDPSESRYWLSWAYSRRDAGDYDDALLKCKKAQAFSPDDPAIATLMRSLTAKVEHERTAHPGAAPTDAPIETGSSGEK